MGNDEFGPEPTPMFFVGTTDGVNFVTLFGEWLNPNTGEFRIRKGNTKVQGVFKGGSIQWVGNNKVWTKMMKPNF